MEVTGKFFLDAEYLGMLHKEKRVGVVPASEYEALLYHRKIYVKNPAGF